MRISIRATIPQRNLSKLRRRIVAFIAFVIAVIPIVVFIRTLCNFRLIRILLFRLAASCKGTYNKGRADGKTYNAGDLKPTWVTVQEKLNIKFEDKISFTPSK